MKPFPFGMIRPSLIPLKPPDASHKNSIFSAIQDREGGSEGGREEGVRGRAREGGREGEGVQNYL